MRIRPLIWAATPAAALALAACGAGEKVIDRSELEQDAKEQLTQEVGEAPKSVSCPDELKAEADASTRCTITAQDGSKVGMTITVKSVDGDKAQYSISVDGP